MILVGGQLITLPKAVNVGAGAVSPPLVAVGPGCKRGAPQKGPVGAGGQNSTRAEGIGGPVGLEAITSQEKAGTGACHGTVAQDQEHPAPSVSPPMTTKGPSKAPAE